MTSPAPKPPRKPKPCPHRDPLGYANRALEKSFNPYLSLHEHITKLNASLKAAA